MSDRNEKDTGLVEKYAVKRHNDPGGKHHGCRYFVLDPQHDPIAAKALKVYADEAERAGYPILAGDLRVWLWGTSRATPRVRRSATGGTGSTSGSGPKSGARSPSTSTPTGAGAPTTRSHRCCGSSE